MKTAEYIIKRLEELGINVFFGVPGDYNFNILYSIEHNPNTKWVGCTNELNAGYAADGYARLRGYGAVITTFGVGEMSAINAIAGCMSENIPVINIVGLPSSDIIENKTLVHHSLLNTNYKAFFDSYSSVTAASAFLTKDNAKIEIDRVLKTFVNEKKPVYIALPEDIAADEISDRRVIYDIHSDKETLENAAHIIADKILASKSPVIIGDTLIKRFDAEIEYKEFVEKSGIPVSNFIMGTNIINMDYEKYLGGYYADLRNPIANKYIKESDCLIFVGVIYSDINSFGQHLSKDINEEIAIFGNYTYIEGKKYENIKMANLLEAVTNIIETKNIEIDKPAIGYKQNPANSENLTSAYIYPRIQEFIKDNDIIIAESGTIPFGISQIKFPSSANIETQLLWSSIGWATPAALGMCLAKPQSRIILISGDGAHLMTGMEIGTILKQGLKPIIIIINNNGYTVERLLSGNPDIGFNDTIQLNYAKFARAFEGDVWATKVSTADDFDKALKVTQIMNKMCYIEVCIDSLDVTQLTKDYVNSVKKSDTIELKEPDYKDYNIENFVSDSAENSLEYETVVHKGFSFIDKEKNNEKEINTNE